MRGSGFRSETPEPPIEPGDGPSEGLGRLFVGDARARPRFFPFMVLVVVAHGVFLALRASLVMPGTVGALLAVLVVWNTLPFIRRDTLTRTVTDHGNLVIAAIAMASDGGTESPLFFWILLFLAAQVLRHRSTNFALLCANALGGYALVVTATREFTAASAGRAFLFVAYCAALFLGLRELERRRREAIELDRLVVHTFDAAPLGVAIFSGSPNRVIYANRDGRRMIADLLDSESPATVIDEEGVEVAPADRLADAFDREGPGGPDIFAVRLPGSPVRYVRVLYVPSTTGSRRFLLVFAEDVSDQIQADAERTRFLEAAAHQFRTPLTPIRTYAELLVEGTLDPIERVEAAFSIREHAIALERLLEQLTTILRVRSSEMLEVGPVPVTEVLGGVGHLVPEMTGRMLFEGPFDLEIVTHAGGAAHGLAELVRNGLVHGIPPVTLELSVTDGCAEFRIADAGPGPAIPDSATFSDVWYLPGTDERVSPRMGTQLGLTRADIHLWLAAGTLHFERSGAEWAFVVRFDAAGPD